MFDLFNSRPADVKGIRNAMLQFIKEQLQKVEGGEGANIRSLHLYIFSKPAEKHLYESAIFLEEGDRFKVEEIERIAEDYAIALPTGWEFEYTFIDSPPAEAARSKEVDVALFVSTQSKPLIYKKGSASVKVLNGEAEKAEYQLDSAQGKINIGRDKKARMADGFFRENTIAFPGESTNESNRSISRQHAHIEWDASAGSFYIFADEGGIPPMNKTKVRRADGTLEKIQTIEIGHRLQPGDQVMLGESAVLEFSAPQNGQNIT